MIYNLNCKQIGGLTMKRILKIIFVLTLFFTCVLITDKHYKANSETTEIVTPSNPINPLFEKDDPIQ